MNVHFLFEGDEEIPSTHLTLPISWLEAKPHSVLSKLATDRWSRDSPEQKDGENRHGTTGNEQKEQPPSPEQGSTQGNPLRSQPLLSCPNTWSPPVAEMIRQAYDPSLEGKITLVGRVELQEAVEVLDFYGLAPLNLKNYIFEDQGLDLMVVTRARIYVRGHQGLEEFLARLDNYKFVTSETNFLFKGPDHSIEYIRESNDIKIHNYFSEPVWLGEEYFRNLLCKQLRERGFDAKLKQCYISIYGPRIEYEYDKRDMTWKNLWFLTLCVPIADRPKKRLRC